MTEVPFSESPYAWKGPFRPAYVGPSASTRNTPLFVAGPAPSATPTVGSTIKTELLTILATNSVPSLSFAPDGQMTFLFVNGRAFAQVAGAFSVNGVVVTWTSTIFSINPGDEVVACYTYSAT